MISSYRNRNSLPGPVLVTRAVLLILCATAVIIIGVRLVAIGKSVQDGRRGIVSEDFTQARPAPTPKAPKPSGRHPTIGRRRPLPKPTSDSFGNSKRYRLASSSSTNTESPANTENLAQLGITIWRLRPATAADTGARMLVMEVGKPREWVPERIEADTPLNIGDRVRLTIESPRAGYLYIVDRDLFADGTMGDAMLIFPTLNTRGGDNQVRAGKLIDIPAQDDAQSYFTAKPVRSDQVGEVLSLIVTSTPLDLPVTSRPLQISASEIARWEKMWSAGTERFEMVGGAGEQWTKEEKQAAATSSRQLTQDDPSPQTIYRVSATSTKAILVNIGLRYVK